MLCFLQERGILHTQDTQLCAVVGGEWYICFVLLFCKSVRPVSFVVGRIVDHQFLLLSSSILLGEYNNVL